MANQEKIILAFAVTESFGTSSDQFISKANIQNLLSQYEYYFDGVTTVEGFLEKNSHLCISAENIAKAEEAYSKSLLYNR